MSPEYKELRKTADTLFLRFNDIVDDKSSIGSLLGDIRNVVEEFEMSKNPHSIEDRVKRIIEDLKELKRGDGTAMSYNHIDDLVAKYEELREDVRKLPNY